MISVEIHEDLIGLYEIEFSKAVALLTTIHDVFSGGYRGGGGQTRPMPPLTNKDTPPVHCNEFNYMSLALALAGARPVVRAKYHP